ncbi:CsbD family protein [Kineococcus endophyticus]|uniref:CsbD family protein n=1 Tax=Kineococcus endophyticus TaxID=1181883 RepID=A0ABV3P2Q4_9ACTN
MSFVDKAKNVVQQTVGKAEEAVGKRTDDQEQIAQGQKDQAMGAARQETEKAKDALHDK